MNWLKRRSMSKYPSIVMLHYVSDDPAIADHKPWLISHRSYVRLLDYFEKNGYKTVGFEDLQTVADTSKAVIITFDDCPKHLWDFALPELKRRNMKAVFYMPTARIGEHNEWDYRHGKSKVELMDETDITGLVEAGMEVGSHAHKHEMMSELTVESAEKALYKSKAILEQITGRPVVSVAYPYGSLPRSYKRIAQSAGYHFGLGVYVKWQTKYAIRRWTYTDEDTEEDIRWKMSGSYQMRRALQDKYVAYKRTILNRGYKMYRKVKDIFVQKAVLLLSFEEFCEVDYLLLG